MPYPDEFIRMISELQDSILNLRERQLKEIARGDATASQRTDMIVVGLLNYHERLTCETTDYNKEYAYIEFHNNLKQYSN